MGDEGNKIQPDIDRWLDGALRARIDSEPRPGLEERVLARLASEPERNSLVWWPVLSAIAAVIVIAVALVALRSGERRNLANGIPEPTKPSQSAGNTASLPNPSVTPTAKFGSQKYAQSATDRDAACCVSTETVKPAMGGMQREPLPKLATFPAPQPETAEERMLARLAARRGSFDIADMSSDSGPLEKLSISKLEVDPMEGTPPDSNPRE